VLHTSTVSSDSTVDVPLVATVVESEYKENSWTQYVIGIITLSVALSLSLSLEKVLLSPFSLW
jgi:hypothetical protein